MLTGIDRLEGGHTDRQTATSDVNVIQDMPKLSDHWLSDTGLGQLYPISKTFLPKTKFSLSIFLNDVYANDDKRSPG